MCLQVSQRTQSPTVSPLFFGHALASQLDACRAIFEFRLLTAVDCFPQSGLFTERVERSKPCCLHAGLTVQYRALKNVFAKEPKRGSHQEFEVTGVPAQLFPLLGLQCRLAVSLFEVLVVLPE